MNLDQVSFSAFVSFWCIGFGLRCMLVALRWVFIAAIALKYVLACNLTSHSTCQVCSSQPPKYFPNYTSVFGWDYWRSHHFFTEPEPAAAGCCFSVFLGGGETFRFGPQVWHQCWSVSTPWRSDCRRCPWVSSCTSWRRNSGGRWCRQKLTQRAWGFFLGVVELSHPHLIIIIISIIIAIIIVIISIIIAIIIVIIIIIIICIIIIILIIIRFVVVFGMFWTIHAGWEWDFRSNSSMILEKCLSVGE